MGLKNWFLLPFEDQEIRLLYVHFFIFPALTLFNKSSKAWDVWCLDLKPYWCEWIIFSFSIKACALPCNTDVLPMLIFFSIHIFRYSFGLRLRQSFFHHISWRRNIIIFTSRPNQIILIVMDRLDFYRILYEQFHTVSTIWLLFPCA